MRRPRRCGASWCTQGGHGASIVRRIPPPLPAPPPGQRDCKAATGTSRWCRPCGDRAPPHERAITVRAYADSWAKAVAKEGQADCGWFRLGMLARTLTDDQSFRSGRPRRTSEGTSVRSWVGQAPASSTRWYAQGKLPWPAETGIATRRERSGVRTRPFAQILARSIVPREIGLIVCCSVLGFDVAWVSVGRFC